MEAVNAGRAIAKSLDKEALDLMIKGKVSTVIECGEETACKCKRQKFRKRVRCRYTHERESDQFWYIVLFCLFE